jgi:hypothetical protein
VFDFTCWSGPLGDEVAVFVMAMRHFNVLIMVITIYPAEPKGREYYMNYAQCSWFMFLGDGVGAPFCSMPFRLLPWAVHDKDLGDNFVDAIKSVAAFLHQRGGSLEVVHAGKGKWTWTIGDMLGDLRRAQVLEGARVWPRQSRAQVHGEDSRYVQ